VIALVDAGLGNLRSVEKALRHVGADVKVTDDPDVIRAAERVVVPGQGAFGDCGRALSREAPLGRAVLEAIQAGKPYLGICLGLQVLFESSEEAPGCRGLGVFRGKVVRIRNTEGGGQDGSWLKVPHMGWNPVTPTRRGRAHPLLTAAFAAMQQDPVHGGVPFYFVHSYHAVPVEPFLVDAVAQYGRLSLTAAVGIDNVFAVQFHPEKSQRAGLALLAAFLDWKC
jgi:glutamine amidotransferase